MKRQQRKLLTLAQLSRRLDLPYSSLHAWVEEGILKPDEIVGRFRFFDERKIARILVSLRGHVPQTTFETLAARFGLNWSARVRLPNMLGGEVRAGIGNPVR